jgi:hypothetical protein
VKYRTISEAKDGRVKARSPHAAPNRKAVTARSTIEKDMPIPMVVKTIEAITMVRVDGKATRLIKL